MVCLASSNNGSSHDGDEARRQRASTTVARGARGGIRRRGERGWEQELTGRRRSRSVGSGTSLTARIDGEGLGCPRLKMTAMTMKQGLPASHSSIGRTRRFLRCFWTRRKGEGA